MNEERGDASAGPRAGSDPSRGETPLRSPPEGVTIRSATARDMAALAALEREVPTRTADGAIVTIDRGSALQAHFDLQREYVIQVAERDGRIVASRAYTIRQVEIDGATRRWALSHFVRLLPEMRGQGLFEVLDAAARRDAAPLDHVFAYMDPGNDAMRGAARRNFGTTMAWSVQPFRALLACASLAGPDVGRPASASDAKTIANLVNSAHAGEGFFVPCSEEGLRERLSRVADAYSWNDLLVTDHAVVGVWRAEERRRVEHGSQIEETRRALVLDYGFSDDARGMADLEALLRAWCRIARDAGDTHLSVFSSGPSRSANPLTRMAEKIELYEFPTSLPEPGDLDRFGVYVDPIYF